MLTTREFKVAKSDYAHAAKMYRVRNNGVMDAASFVNQFMTSPKYMGHRALLHSKIFMAMVWEHIWGVVNALIWLTLIGFLVSGMLVIAFSALATLFAAMTFNVISHHCRRR